MEPAKNVQEPPPASEPPARLFGSTLPKDEQPIPGGLVWAGVLLLLSAALGAATLVFAPQYAGLGLARLATHVFVAFDLVAALLLLRKDDRVVIPVIVRAVAGILLHVALGLRIESAWWLVFNSLFHVGVVLLLVGYPSRARIAAGMVLALVPFGLQVHTVSTSFLRNVVRVVAGPPEPVAYVPPRRPNTPVQLADLSVTLPDGWERLDAPTHPRAYAEFYNPYTDARVVVFRWHEPYADALDFDIVLRKIVQDMPSALLPNGATWQTAPPYTVRRLAEARGTSSIQGKRVQLIFHARAERVTRFAISGYAPVSTYKRAEKGLLELMRSIDGGPIVPVLARSSALAAAVDGMAPALVQIRSDVELANGVIVAARGEELDAVCLHRWVKDDKQVTVAYAGTNGALEKAEGTVVAVDPLVGLALVRFRAPAGTRRPATLASSAQFTGPTEVHLVGFPASGSAPSLVAPVRLAGPWGGKTEALGRFDLLDAPHDRRLSGSAVVLKGELLGLAVIDLDEPEGNHGVGVEVIRKFLETNR